MLSLVIIFCLGTDLIDYINQILLDGIWKICTVRIRFWYPLFIN